MGLPTTLTFIGPAVAAALRDDFLTTGPKVEAFEAAFADFVGARHAVACANGTAALHLAPSSSRFPRQRRVSPAHG